MKIEYIDDRLPYKKSNSVDENMINGQIYSANSAFEGKISFSNNDNSQSQNTQNLTFPDDGEKVWKILVSNDINLEDFPVPPLPKEFRNSTRLFVPIKREEIFKKYLAEADRLVETREYEKAKQLYLKATKLDPLDSMVWKALGHIYLIEGKLMEWFNWFQGCLFDVENQQDPKLWYALGELYSKMDENISSILAYTAVLDFNPDNQLLFRVHWKLGLIKWRINELDAAYDHFQKALLLDNSSVDQKVNILIKLGLIEEERGDLNKAILKYLSALNLDWQTREVYAHIAWWFFKSKNYTKWNEYLIKIESTSGANIDSELCLSAYINARMNEESKNYEKAIELYRKVVESERENAAYWWSFTVVSFEIADYENAMVYAQKAVELNPKLSESQYNIAVLLEIFGREREALHHYNKLIKVHKFDEFAKKRILVIERGSTEEKDSLKASTVNILKHPEYVIKNSLEFSNCSQSNINLDFASTFKAVYKNKTPDRSPTRNVRFLNVPNRSSEDPKVVEKVSAPVSGLDYLNKMRQEESRKSKIFKNKYL